MNIENIVRKGNKLYKTYCNDREFIKDYSILNKEYEIKVDITNNDSLSSVSVVYECLAVRYATS